MNLTRKQSGFTLIELVTVILILGLLAATAAPRFLSKGSFESRTVEDKLISVARHAQQLAMSKAVTANVQMLVDSGNDRIRITYTEGGTQTIDTELPNGFSISGNPSNTVTFSKAGNANAAYTFTIQGGRSVTIETTGYTHAN